MSEKTTEIVDRAAQLVKISERITEALENFAGSTIIGEEEIEANGHISMETCNGGTEAIQKAERRLYRLLRGIHRVHQQVEEYSEGNKDFP